MSRVDRNQDQYLSRPVQRAARLLRHIAEGDPVNNMSRTSRALGINRTTLLRLLHTLEAERFLEKRGEGQGLRIGIGLVGVAAQVFSEDLLQTSVPVISRLAEALKLSAHLAVLDGLEIVYLVRKVPNHVYASNIRIGSRLPAYATNMGRIILAHLPEDYVERLYAGSVLDAFTCHTATTLSQLRTQLAADRCAGVAWSDGYYETEISSVAAAVFDLSNVPVGALNVTGASADFADNTRRAQIAKAVCEAAREISQRLGSSHTDATALPFPGSRSRQGSQPRTPRRTG